jgi:thiol-disulfide isomerase/thioredoxin
MLLRLIITLAIILIGGGALLALRSWHISQTNRGAAYDLPSTGLPALLYFRSDDCGPCVTQSRYLQALEGQFGKRLTIHKIDADRDRRTAEKYGVFTLPTTLIVDPGGQVKHINYGLTATSKLARQLEKASMTPRASLAK